MRRSPATAARVGVAAVAAAVAALGLAACTTPSSPLAVGSTTAAATGAGTPAPTAAPAQATRPPLVVETVFDHTTLDPTRQFERSGLMLSKALYQTLTTIDPTDRHTVMPGIAEYSISPEGNWLTLRLLAGLTFSDGTPITSDDVIFTLERAQGLQGPTAALIGNLTFVRVDARTLTVTSPGANFALPAILANPAFGILNSKVVRDNGGTIGPQDSVAAWLTTHSAGSGPYVIAESEPGRSVTLTRNPRWTGPAPAFQDVIVRNASQATQIKDVESGAADVVLDLSPTQADALKLLPAVTSVSVTAMLSQSTAFLLLNKSPKVNRWTGNPDFAQAVRLGLDVQALAEAAGDARPALGLIPEGMTGAFQLAPQPTPTATGTPAPGGTVPQLPSAPVTPPPRLPGASSGAVAGTSSPVGSPTSLPAASTAVPTPTAPPVRDLAGAKAALARSGYKGQPIPLAFAIDRPIQGIAPANLARAVAAQLAQVGIKVRLAPAPAAKALNDYRAGKDAMGLWSWTPDYIDPEDYLVFAPGGLVALRAGWPRDVDGEMDDATVTTRAAYGRDRATAFARWQLLMNERSPFVPLIQPMLHYAHGARVTQLSTNPVWTLDVARVR